MIRLTRKELEIILAAAERVARRTRSRFVLWHDRIEIVDDKGAE